MDTRKHADAKQNVGGAWLIETSFPADVIAFAKAAAVKKVGTYCLSCAAAGPTVSFEQRSTVSS